MPYCKVLWNKKEKEQEISEQKEEERRLKEEEENVFPNFMKENKDTLLSALNNTIALYLEPINLSPNISICLKEITPRTTLEKPVFEKMVEMQDSCCFYCSNDSGVLKKKAKHLLSTLRGK